MKQERKITYHRWGMLKMTGNKMKRANKLVFYKRCNLVSRRRPSAITSNVIEVANLASKEV